MDIRNWGLDELMMLPDHCFGSRWPIMLRLEGAAVADVFAISTMALPERCIIWEVRTIVLGTFGVFDTVGLRLGDNLPGSLAEFYEMDLLLRGLPGRVGTGSELCVTSMAPLRMNMLKYPLKSAGRRLVVGMRAGVMAGKVVCVNVVVSSVPREVPDCLLSV